MAFHQEHFYDGQKNTGFLSWRLKTVQRGTKPFANKDDPKTEEKGGPLLDRQLCHHEDQLDIDQSLEAISLMNHTSDREVITQKMRATFEYRQRLVHDPESSTTILSVFPRFLDTKGLVWIVFPFFNQIEMLVSDNCQIVCIVETDHI